MTQRDVFFDSLLSYALIDDRVILLYGDVGGVFLDKWLEAIPNQTINTMPAEQSGILIAAGLAKAGFKPFLFTIIPFLIFRPFEMIRIYLSHQRLPVRLVGVGAGRSYQTAGFTHWDNGDVQVMRTTTIDVWSNYGSKEHHVIESAKWAYENNRPSYVRLER